MGCLGCQEPDDAGEDDSGAVVVGVLVVAGGDASPALEAVEGSFDDVAVAVHLGVEAWWSAVAAAFARAVRDLVALLGDDHADSSPAQRSSGQGVGVGLVCDHALWTATWAPSEPRGR